MEAHTEMKRLWAGRRNGEEGFGDIFGVTVRLAEQEGRWRQTVRVREENTYKGGGS